MRNQAVAGKAVGIIQTSILLAFAIWLLLPFVKIDRADYASSKTAIYRLALGLIILLFYIGKWFFDFLAPQGLGEKVSSLRAVFLIFLSMIILAFVVYVIIQAGSLFLTSSSRLDDVTFFP